ncbi:MAG: ribose 5-phosphate isomerase A [Clostridia bacterium]|nr:ribose 5-phosphate isomerase A [Clostridia bacterium]
MNLDTIKNRDKKIDLARRMSKRVKDGDVIGFGSGSTSYLTVIEIAKEIEKRGIKIKAVPTSIEIEGLCKKLKIPLTTLTEEKLDWCFDGADEVDPNNWLIKGKGAAMFREKINFVNCEEIYVLVDDSKKVRVLGEKESVPIEVFPAAVNYVKRELEKFNIKEVTLREKDTKIISTDNGNYILDVKFKEITENLEKELKKIVGVIETGLFINYNVNILT